MCALPIYRREIRLFLRVRELRNRDRGQNADDHDHDQKLNQSETLAVHLDDLPCMVQAMARIFALRTSTNHALDRAAARKQKRTNRLTVWKCVSHRLKMVEELRLFARCHARRKRH